MDRTTVWHVPDDTGSEGGRPPSGAAPADRPIGAGWRWLVAAVFGAVVGGAVSGGIVAALDDDRGPASTSARPSTVVGPQLDVAAILDQVEPAVVSISTTGFNRGNFLSPTPSSGAGTGMILTPDGDVLTNAHVVAGASRIEVKLTSGATMSATLVGSDTTNDVALLRLKGASGLPTVKLGRSADLQVGDGVVAIGNALGLPGGPTVTSGIVSALDRAIGGDDERLEHLIQTDAAINPGNSGGPLVNAGAEVVGMNTAVIQSAGGGSEAQNIGFAISVDTFRPIVDELRQGGERIETRAFLGVVTQTVTDDIRARLGLAAPNGALVVDVEPGSPADAAGIRPGDVITGLGGDRVTSSDGLG
ncbi:MAG: trypsin-like peptidase domain-containing protein, partial [Actinomycetota bacterium]|nr:trypsin-like peptidase domain-containing protein [Actinomycetota bacterium]